MARKSPNDSGSSPPRWIAGEHTASQDLSSCVTRHLKPPSLVNTPRPLRMGTWRLRAQSVAHMYSHEGHVWCPPCVTRNTAVGDQHMFALECSCTYHSSSGTSSGPSNPTVVVVSSVYWTSSGLRMDRDLLEVPQVSWAEPRYRNTEECCPEC